jgi:hypothetical protein
MRRTVLLVAVVALVVLAGCTALSSTGAPLLTVDNQDETEYRLTVYTLSDPGDADSLTFRATDAEGDNRSVETAALRGNTSFRNVTLHTDPDAASRVTVRAGTVTTAAINIWDSGAATVYVVETADGTASLAGVQVIPCGSSDQEHELTVADGTISGRDVTCP